MLTVLFLTGAEKLINIAINSDEITKSGLQPLAGKVMRLNMAMPKLHIDVLFNHERIRFEPVSSALMDTNADGVFERRSGDFGDDERRRAGASVARIGHSLPDCTVSVDNPAQLLNLIRGSDGNLPIAGDYKILMQLKQLVAGFDPDIAGQLEPLIGKPMASQLQLLISQLKSSLGHGAKQAFADVSEWANDVAGVRTPDPTDVAKSDDLKQQLLRLRADIEREEARLQALKAEQARLASQSLQ